MGDEADAVAYGETALNIFYVSTVTAKLIADKIVESNELIFESANSATFDTDHGDSPGMDDIGADADPAAAPHERKRSRRAHSASG